MSGDSRNPRYWLERQAKRRPGFPLATLAFYGPDEKHFHLLFSF